MWSYISWATRHSLNAGPYLLLKVEKVEGKRKRKQTVDLRRTSVGGLKLSESQTQTLSDRHRRRENMSGVTNQEEDKKPADQTAHINLKVKSQVSLSLLGFRFLFLQNL